MKTDNTQSAVKDAASIAGLDVVRAVNEPTAAVLAYDIDLSYRPKILVLVYNLDGTTFEATVVLIEDGVFEILSTVRTENITRSGIDVSLSQQARLHTELQGSQDVSNG